MLSGIYMRRYILVVPFLNEPFYKIQVLCQIATEFNTVSSIKPNI